MRLIDADALIEHLREYKTVYGVPMTDSDKQVIHCIIGHIKNLEPTAYDVEAVVAEPEKERKYCGNCKHQPEPLTTCDWMKSQTVVFKECPRWKRKEQP